jgi:transcriptional regulator GlxA family with amidase domain
MPAWEHAAKRIAAVALDGFDPLDLAVVASVLHAHRRTGEALYSFVVCGVESASVNGAYDFVIDGVRSLEVLDTAGMIIVPGFTREGSGADRSVLAALRKASVRGATIVGIRRGVSVLADAGLLDGRTFGIGGEHGADNAMVADGTIVTCTSPAAALDYCLQVVQSDWGAMVASELARELGVPRFSGQMRISESSSAVPAADAFARTLEWMTANFHRPITIRGMAARAHMSNRHFLRRFREHVGLTPAQWLLTQRVRQAEHLLSSSNLSLKQIAARAGFPSARALSEHFRLRTGTTPTAYRETHRRTAV